MTQSLKEMVMDRKVVSFCYYKDGSLWYTTECGFQFPVPVSDIGNATFMNVDKAVLFMRYIRKHLSDISQARHEALTNVATT